MKHLPPGGLGVVCVAVLTACGSEGKAPPQNPPAPNEVSLTATEYAFQAPDTISGGWITFRLANLGQEIHYGHIVRLEPGRTVPEMVAAYAEAIRSSGPRPRWVMRFGGPGAAAPGGSSAVTQYLEPGSYVWICPVEDSSGAPHFAKGEFKPFVVRAAGPDATMGEAPQADVVVRLTDYSFAVDTPLTPGRHTVRVVNEGVEPHDLVLMRLAPGKTLEDVRRGMNPERPRRPGEKNDPAPSPESLGTGAGGVASIRSRMEVFFDTELTPGEYVLICMTTAPDGRSHIEHGMLLQVTVK